MKLVAQLVDSFYLGKHDIAMMHVHKGIHRKSGELRPDSRKSHQFSAVLYITPHY